MNFHTIFHKSCHSYYQLKQGKLKLEIQAARGIAASYKGEAGKLKSTHRFAGFSLAATPLAAFSPLEIFY